MAIKATADIWWKNAVFYCLDVETFQDSNGDGIGDFAGLTERVDYIAGLGATCIWLMPFFPTPDRDDGYDITDYYSVDQRLGTGGDLVDFLRTASDRGLRVIFDLVCNHTSKEHPWFKSARSSKDSPYRDWYVWADEPHGPEDIVFPGAEESNWEWDEEAGQYYLHRFYSHQPDLHMANPAVRDEIHKIAGYWLHLGFSGFRIDAVPFMLEAVSDRFKKEPDPHRYLRELRAFVQRRRGDVVMLGEANLAPKEQRKFFGDEDGDELQMLFDFIGNQALWLALTREKAAPIEKALKALPETPESCQYANFIRNHDELSLDKLTKAERQEVFETFAPEEDMRIFDRGIRRRTASMLGGDQRMLELAYSVLFSLPGSPVLHYGEEIGMGDLQSLDGRMAVRTPMQ
jgi:maltose alpha-D-glucosyltransferase/alpha-amylase